MDRKLARRLENDKAFRERVARTAREYLKLGYDATTYWAGEWDVAHDLIQAYNPLTKKDFENLEKGHPRFFRLPVVATSISTLGTFIAQTLAGQDTPHKVEGRGPADEAPAEHMNALLKWNSEQQPVYLLMHLWIQDALTYNRGVFYNTWEPIFKPKMEMVMEEDPEELDEFGMPTQYPVVKRTNQKIGGYAAMKLVSPYDWVCDPSFPLWRFQEGRFCGHKFKASWVDLERRSRLGLDDPAYVSPAAVARLKAKKKTAGLSDLSSIASGTGAAVVRADAMMSRTAYERQRAGNPLAAESASKEDPGIHQCAELWARLVPKDYELGDGEEPIIYQITVANGTEVLAVNESTYAHGEFPYSVGEGRPNAHYQFSPSWAMMQKGPQDHVDYLKNRHQEALQRTLGNIFIADPSRVDLDEFLNPDKEGLILALKPEAYGSKIGDVVQQVQIRDLTEHFPAEMATFVQYAETITGVNANMQGVTEGDASATEFAGTQQMAAGRMSSIARLLSVQAIVPQTRQFVALFQEFLDEPQMLRYHVDALNGPPDGSAAGTTSLAVSRDTIQGTFDFIPHDGTLPGTDARRVAAIARLLEAATVFPQVFTPAPGNIDPRQLLVAGAKAAGLNPENFFYNRQNIAPAIQGHVQAATGVTPQVANGGLPQPPAPPTSMRPPGPKPGLLPDLALPSPGMASAAPPQVRPAGMGL